MTEIISVKFKDSGKAYFFDPKNLEFSKDDKVIVKTSSGIECGTVVTGNVKVKDELIVSPLKPVIRKANKHDYKTLEIIKAKEKQAMDICKRRIAVHKLDMKLIDAEYSFDMKKVVFFFIADERIDFRNLVKDLASSLHARIELRQVGVRDQAKLIGGISKCGREFCCKAFLDDFHPVSIKMAKQQSLSLNPTKISGTCGRLMCCLKYEQDAYSYLVRRSPKMGSIVNTPDGVGKVVDINLLTKNLKVQLESQSYPVKYTVDDVKIISNNNNKKNNGK